MKKGLIIFMFSLACFFIGTKIMARWNPYGDDPYLVIGLGLWAFGGIGILILIVMAVQALSWPTVSIKLRDEEKKHK
ncbi:MAG: hypothetical protein U0Y68_10840 [Blastocatellia bacterium]